MEVFLSELAASKLLKLSDYLLEVWGLKAKDKFIDQLTKKIKQISLQPESCPESSEFDNLYKCVVTKQTTFYYRVNAERKEIEIITIFDTRQHPDRISYETRAKKKE